jgi:hypothetical protein
LEIFANLTEENVAILEQELDAEMVAMTVAEKYWMSVERNKVREKVAEWKKEFPEDWRKERRIDFFRYEYARWNKREKEVAELAQSILGKRGANWERQYVTEQFAEIEKKKQSCVSAVNGIKGTGNKGVTVDDEMIALAREFPLENLVEINPQGFAVCINHTDSRASMFCKKNYAHCFACGFNADVIGVYQKLHDVNFIEAVKILSNH